MTQPPDVTGLIVAWSNGDGEANDRLSEAVHAELRALARCVMQRLREELGMRLHPADARRKLRQDQGKMHGRVTLRHGPHRATSPSRARANQV